MYAGVEDVTRRWPKAWTSGLDAEEIQTLIQDAEAQINAALGRRYNVPIATDPGSAPPLLKMLAATLALVDIFDRSQQVPQWITNRIQRAWETLTALADGTFALLDSQGTLIAEGSVSVQSTTEDYVPVFGQQPTLSERTDPQRTQDEADARTGTGPTQTIPEQFSTDQP